MADFQNIVFHQVIVCFAAVETLEMSSLSLSLSLSLFLSDKINSIRALVWYLLLGSPAKLMHDLLGDMTMGCYPLSQKLWTRNETTIDSNQLSVISFIKFGTHTLTQSWRERERWREIERGSGRDQFLIFLFSYIGHYSVKNWDNQHFHISRQKIRLICIFRSPQSIAARKDKGIWNVIFSISLYLWYLRGEEKIVYININIFQNSIKL
jgi:hypothetical protein